MQRKFMKRALELAKKGSRNVFPNPQVGAVIVKDNEIIGEGYHEHFGGHHAEIQAFSGATKDVKDAQMYVTLEPCSHYGKTPPCVLKIIEKGIKKVFISSVDPNPKVSGKGIQMLKDAGIDVEIGLLKEESDQLNKHFYYFIKHHIPYVTVKMATSLDGKYATASGESKWITSEASRYDVHKERAKYHAILVGIETILSDDPKLNVRLDHDTSKQPLRIILDTYGRIPLHSKVVVDDLKTLIFTSYMSHEKKASLESYGVEVLYCETEDERIDLRDMLKKLAIKNIQSIFVEGGKTIHESFLRQKLTNEVILYLAPKLIGGSKGLEHLSILRMQDVLSLRNVSQHIIENDVKIKGELQSCLQE